MTKISTLWCEAGQHSWEREMKRGRKPISCSEHEHLPIPVSNDGLSPLDKARQANATRKNSEWEATKHKVEVIINDPRMQGYFPVTDARPITVDKLKYLVKAIEDGRSTRPPHEIADLEKMMRRILSDPYNRTGHLL